MKILILGVDGYIGWSLAQYLRHRGHDVTGVDNLLKRHIAAEDGSKSCIPQLDLVEKRRLLQANFASFDAGSFDAMKAFVERVEPDVIVNLAQIASAPYSMRGHKECLLTQENNNRTNLAVLWAAKEVNPEIPIVTVGSMGTYGTPNVDIPEGDFELEFRGRRDRCQFPRKPSSYYHGSKCHSSVNCETACRFWNLRITDIMQGVVYGTRALGVENPSAFWVDSAHGTAINRFVAQAIIGHPLTVYGSGQQTRGFLPLRDSLRCIKLLCENPPKRGEYRTVNQFDQAYSILSLAETVRDVAVDMGLPEVEIAHIDNPRVEADSHYYNPDRAKLVELGYEPMGELEAEVRLMLDDLLPYKERIEGLRELVMPKDVW